MASETVSSDHPSAPEVVEKKECEKVKQMAEVVSPPRDTEEKTKVENSMVEEKSIEPPSSEEVTKIAEPEDKVVEKLKVDDASEATVSSVGPEEKPKAEDLTAPLPQPEEKPKVEDLTSLPAEPEEKVEVKPKTEDSTTPIPEPEENAEDKNAEVCQDKGEISSGVAEQVVGYVESKSEEKVEVESFKKVAIEEITQELTKKTTDVPESSIDFVAKEEEEVKQALPEKETEAAAKEDAETSEVEHKKEVTPEVVIAEEENSTVAPAVIEQPEKDSADTVVKEVVEVSNDKETCGDKVEGVEFSNEKAKDVIEEPKKEKTEIESEVKIEENKGEETKEPIQVIEKEMESSGEKIEKVEETIKPATEEITEATSFSEKADELVNTSRDIGLLTETGSIKDEKVSDDVENKVEDDVAVAASKGSASLGELLKPQAEEKEQEHVKADVEKEKTFEETDTIDGVVKSEESTKDDDTKETSKDTPVEDVPVTKSKQSNNILTKVKQSLVKAKKAIIGKSPNSKTPSSETKSEIKV